MPKLWSAGRSPAAPLNSALARLRSMEETIHTSISTKKLSEQLGNPELVVVDVRNTAAYNGWKLTGEARGGHIPGAVDFPVSWTENIQDADLRTLLKSKGISSNKTVVVYDYETDKSALMARMLRDSGYENVLTYDAGLAEWAANASLPMAHLANYEKLVHPEWMNKLINDENPETYSGKGFIIFEVSFGESKEYNDGHIPGAVHLDTNAIEEEPLWNRVSDKVLEEMLLAHGVTHDVTVVLYSNDTTAAARAASILMYAGVKDVRLLDGGFAAWTSAGYAIETEAPVPVPVGAFGKKIPSHPEYIIDTEQVKAILADGNAALVSVRSWAEYIGETSGYSYIKPRGRIAGAVWGHSGSDPHHMQHYRNVDNTMRNYHEIASNWRDVGVTPDKRVAFYCGTGWRASEAFFYAHLMGWTNISVYDGGWFEWSLDKSNPVELGDPRSSQ
jgi:3-mercaptopyruvate sulfurtransferase SseA